MSVADRRARVLVVDDEPMVLKAIADILEDDFEVRVTISPVQALTWAAADPELAVVIADQRMPTMLGDELLRRLREVSIASTMLITGYADLESVVRAVNEGSIAAFITKPWSSRELRSRVSQAAGQFRLRRAEAALRTSEERLRLAFQASKAGLFDWDLKTGQVSYSSTELTEPGNVALGAEFDNIEQRIHPTDIPLLRAAIQTHLETRQPFKGLHVRAQAGDGGPYRWHDLNAQAAWDDNGQPVRLVGSFLDIEELRQAQGKLVQAQKLEGIGQLAAGIAHEINTPTQYVTDNVTFMEKAFGKLQTVIAAYAEVAAAARGGADPAAALAALDAKIKSSKLDYLLQQAPRALQQSLEGLAHVSSIVKAMKEFSHPGSAEKQQMDVHGIIESTSVVARNEWKYVAELSFDFDHDLPTVPVLRHELSQVFLNLIVNAAHAIATAKAADAERVGQIRIGTRALDDSIEVRVTDTGTGIPEAIRSRIFEPFFTTKEVGKGTGQGLAIAYSVIVDKHGGSIHCESEPGHGATFVIRLPRDTEKSAEA